MRGVWDHWLEGTTLDEPLAFGDITSYRLGSEWLSDCDIIEDWGCGKGGLRIFVPAHRYRGIDGSKTPFADIEADLVSYQSDVCGIFIRHVLEHNFTWGTILDNAIISARSRLFIALFTPLSTKTHQIAWNDELGVPDISFRLYDILAPISQAGFVVQSSTMITDTQYGTETIIKAKRPDALA